MAGAIYLRQSPATGTLTKTILAVGKQQEAHKRQDYSAYL